MPDPSDPPRTQDAALETFLHRPLADRVREFKYRFAQAAVFGLPVIALQYAGPHLGAGESGRWIGLFQALLAGWFVYVSSGMLFEGLIHGVRGNPTVDLLVILAVIGLYLVSLIAWLTLLPAGRPWFPPVFHWPVLLILGWAGFRWAQLRRRRTRAPYTPPAPPG